MHIDMSSTADEIDKRVAEVKKLLDEKKASKENNTAKEDIPASADILVEGINKRFLTTKQRVILESVALKKSQRQFKEFCIEECVCPECGRNLPKKTLDESYDHGRSSARRLLQCAYDDCNFIEEGYVPKKNSNVR